MFTRRAFLSGGAAGSLMVFARSAGAAEYSFVQFHNQPAGSSLHRGLVALWTDVRRDTGGRVDTTVYAENRGIAGSDPAALTMLQAGDIQFFTLMGGILANVVPAADVQQVPFAFRSAADAHRAMDGELGAYLRREIAAKGLIGLPTGAFDNGMRQIASTSRPIRTPGDLAGLKMRVPAGEIFAETFRAFGAEPVTVNVADLPAAMKNGSVDAQENPLAVVELFKLYEVARYVSLTNHMWSGFNLLAHAATWTRLPGDIRTIVERNVAAHARAQREDQRKLNAALRAGLERRGLVFNEVDQAPFRAKLAGVYSALKTRLGSTCWSLLEAATGRTLA